MTTRIALDQQIGGQPIARVRDFFRTYRRQEITASSIEHHFALSRPRARTLSTVLERAGYLEPASGTRGYRSERAWTTTRLGEQLANATAAPPITRQTADRLLGELLERIRAVNEGPYAYRVQRAFVFGSYLLPERDRLGDLDVALDLRPRFPDASEQAWYERERIALALSTGRSFRNIFAEVRWPINEVILHLRQRRRALSLHNVGEGEASQRAFVFGVRHQQFYPSPSGEPHPEHDSDNAAASSCSCASGGITDCSDATNHG